MIALLQDPAGKGGTATTVRWYRAWMDENRPAERAEYFLDDGSATGLRQMCVGAAGGGVPRLWPRLHVPQYAAGAWLLRRRLSGQEIHVVGATAVHGAMAGSRQVQIVWLATTIADERKPDIWRGRSRSRRVLYRSTRRPLAGMEHQVLRRADRVLAMSPYTADQLIAAKVDPRRVEVVRVPVDTAHFTPGPADERRGAVFVGRVDDWRKGFDRIERLVATSSMVRHRGVEVASQSRPRATTGLRPLGRVEDLAPLYRRAEVLLLPSRQEGLGIVALEALACGTPVVAFRCGGPDHILDQSGAGVLVDDEAAFRREAEHLLSTPHRRTDMGGRGRAWVEANASAAAFLSDRSTFEAR